MIRPYKWAYDPASGTLDVWPVSGPEPYATPQHADHLTAEQYATFYQGRVVLGDDGVESFTFYDDRPFALRTSEGADAAREAIGEWVSENE